MNDKQEYLDKIVEIVVRCCVTPINNRPSYTKEELLGNSRKENVVMSRCILVSLILAEGFSVSTIADLLNRSAHQIRNMHNKWHDYYDQSRAFRKACSQANMLMESIRGEDS